MGPIKAELLVQSGARWLGVALDLVGSMVVFSSVLSCLITFEDAEETIGLTLNYSLQVPIYLAWVIKFMTDLESCFNSVERVVEYTELDHENLDQGTDTDDITDVEEIKFDNVALSHGDSARPVVHGLNCKITSGLKLAIVGRSGSGKSTIVESLLGMSNVVKGAILINGLNIESYSLTKIRTIVKAIPQEVSHFGNTIKDALDPSNKFKHNDDDDEMEKIMVNLLENLGISSCLSLDQSMNSLSPGQKQEIAIAQALIQDPKVLILDEATSVIETEKKFVTNLLRICSEKKITLISVMHRLTNIMEYDNVIVIGDGRMLEDGKPLNLLKKPMGFFSSLYRNSV